MSGSNSTECNETSYLNKQQFRLHKINEIKDYFIAEIKERELMSRRLSKYIASLDYFDKSLIVLLAKSGRTPAGIASASLSLTFLLSTGNNNNNNK